MVQRAIGPEMRLTRSNGRFQAKQLAYVTPGMVGDTGVVARL
jgi:hypothetical protein